MFLLILISLLGYCLLINRAFKLASAHTPIVVIPLLSLTLYAGALLNALESTSQFCWILGIIAFSAILVHSCFLRKLRQLVAENIPLCLFSLVYLLLLIGYTNVHFKYDNVLDFSGLALKVLFHTNALPTAQTPMSYKDYTLVCSLFQYFFLNIYGHYSETYALLAQGIFIFSGLFSVMQFKGWKRQWLSLMLLALGILTFRSNALHNIYVDVAVSCYFAGILLTAHYLKNNPYRLLIILPALAMLPQIKQIGIFFAVLIIIYLALESLTLLWKQKDNKVQHWRALLIALFILPTAVYFSHFSWVQHYQRLGITKTFQTKKIKADVINGIATLDLNSEKQTVIKHFWHTFFFQGKKITHIHLPVSVYFLLLILALSVAWRLAKKDSLEQWRYLLLGVTLTIGFLAYSLGLLGLYLYSSFYPDEVVRLASMGRYLSIYLLGFLLILIGIFCQYLPDLNNSWGKKVGILSIVGFVLLIAVSPPRGYARRVAYPYVLSEKIKRYLPDTASNILVVDRGNKTTFMVFSYELYPNVIYLAGHHLLYSPRPPQRQLLKEELAKVDYVLLVKTDQAFWQAYGSILPIQHPFYEAHFLQVIKTPQAKLSFKKLF